MNHQQRIRQELISQYDQFRLDEPFDVVVNLKGEGTKSDIIIEVLFIIDVSGSMTGEKLDLVKKSLLLFSDLLRDKNCENQLSLISFSTDARLELPWTMTTNDNRELIEESITELQIVGSTDISSGFSEAISQLSNKNQDRETVTYVVLLSDGEDNFGSELCYEMIQEIIQDSDIPFNYGLLIFGYGVDQDPVLLDNIAKLKNGLYYNIRNIQDAEIYFHQVFQIIENTFAQDIIIEIAPILPFEISSYNDQEFFKVDDKLQAKLELFKIGDTKDYFVQMICKKENAQSLSSKEHVPFMSSKLNADLVCQNKKIDLYSEGPQLHLCEDENIILHVNPQYELKQLLLEANQVIKQIIEFNKQGDIHSGNVLANNMVYKLKNCSQNQETQIKHLVNGFIKIQQNEQSKKQLWI